MVTTAGTHFNVVHLQPRLVDSQNPGTLSFTISTTSDPQFESIHTFRFSLVFFNSIHFHLPRSELHTTKVGSGQLNVNNSGIVTRLDWTRICLLQFDDYVTRRNRETLVHLNMTPEVMIVHERSVFTSILRLAVYLSPSIHDM